MTAVNHPCEVLSDLYVLSRDADLTQLRFLFVGADGNIGRGWWEAAQAFGLDVRQACPEHLRIEGMPWAEDLPDAMRSAGVVIIDGPGSNVNDLAPYRVTRVTAELLDMAPRGVRFVPCPPLFEAGRLALTHSCIVHLWVTSSSGSCCPFTKP